MRRLILLAVLLAGCTAHENLPPALPEEPAVFQPPLAMQEPALNPFANVPISAEPVITPSKEELAPASTKKVSLPPAKPEKVIQQANTQALMTPSLAGYRDGRTVVQRYPYVPGQMYEVYSSPHHPTTIVLPPGEYMAIAPDIDTESDDTWVVAPGEMGDGPTYQQFLKVRPLRAGLEHTTSFVMQSGLILPVRLRSFAKTSMVVVTWDMPRRAMPISSGPRPRAPGLPARRKPDDTPKVDPARMHTAYSIQTTKGNPPWVPLSVYDDGTKTVIRFREDLGFTQAPAPFAMDSEGKLNLVQFIPYKQEGGATLYIIQGLYPKLELKGDGGSVVTILRQTGRPAPYEQQPAPATTPSASSVPAG